MDFCVQANYPPGDHMALMRTLVLSGASDISALHSASSIAVEFTVSALSFDDAVMMGLRIATSVDGCSSFGVSTCQ